MNVIFKRRSIRRYQNKKIKREDAEKLVHAGLCAPTAMGRRPWHFVVIDDRKILDKIPGIHRYAAMASSAPLAILVCGDREIQRIEGYMAQDLAAASENILLMATSMGLGGVWCGVYPREERMEKFSRLLDLPADIMPFSLLVIGYPDEKPKDVDRLDLTRIHHNGW
jgi:nitroreductase